MLTSVFILQPQVSYVNARVYRHWLRCAGYVGPADL